MFLPMLDSKTIHFPTIIYRPMQPSDLDALEQIHAALFPISYERQFFLNVVNEHGIVSWAAVVVNELDGRGDELVGFVTTRTVGARDSEVDDFLLYDISRKDATLVYILTLGVAEHYRNLGIATSLIQEVIKYASSITSCRAVYLHVIAYNHPAIHFYKKMLFKLVKRLQEFYYINGQHYDSYLFVYYVNGGQAPCSPLRSIGNKNNLSFSKSQKSRNISIRGMCNNRTAWDLSIHNWAISRGKLWQQLQHTLRAY
ncbi:histone acetyltransferase MCC1-like isoform X3 [Asparagus officinalis]|uniref:histone acetyltransferase MCC1-like isoform X3 n=1 Tax=Asparagus officinalis TaxID=4686 RepID=UPI00098E503F|nr:histone acetyltransferase MCC1-like isoform X3 [Asparagus officinalis]